MLRQAMKPDRLSYGGLTSACEKGKEMRRACDVRADMLHQATDPDMVSYGALIKSCEKGAEIRRAFDVCADMLRHAIQPNMVIYSALISACDKVNEMRWALDVCADMLRHAMEPNMVSYSKTISACEKQIRGCGAAPAVAKRAYACHSLRGARRHVPWLSRRRAVCHGLACLVGSCGLGSAGHPVVPGAWGRAHGGMPPPGCPSVPGNGPG